MWLLLLTLFQQAAIDVIDETLYKRGQMHLIYGQPLHPVAPPARFRTVEIPPAPQPELYTRDRSTASVRMQPLPPVAGPSARQAAATNGVSAKAGPSKRPASPATVAGPPKKKAKETSRLPACLVCGQPPAHALKSCPVVMQGSSRFVHRFCDGRFDINVIDRIEKEVRRLEKDSRVPRDMLETLRKLQIRYQQREQLSHSGSANPLS